MLGTVPDMDGADTRAAIEAAEKAFGPWRAKTNAERGALLEAWHDLMLDTYRGSGADPDPEQGKPLTEARGEIRYGASFVKWFAEEARRIGGHDHPLADGGPPHRRAEGAGRRVGDHHAVEFSECDDHPQGRAGARRRLHRRRSSHRTSPPIRRWRSACWRSAPASPRASINIVTGMPTEIGNELMANQTVRKISFTGSTRVGSLLMRGAADSIKRLSLELGGNAPFIVFDDADLDLAVEGAIASKFRNGGQTCVCANRILVQAGVYDAFAAKLSARVSAMKVGAGTRCTAPISGR